MGPLETHRLFPSPIYTTFFEKVGFWAKSRNFDRFGRADPISPTFESGLDLAECFRVLLEAENVFWGSDSIFVASARTHIRVRGCAGLGSPGVISERLSRRVGRGSECSVVASITLTPE